MSGGKVLLTGLVLVAMTIVPALPARAQNGVLYELTESQKIMNRKVTKRTDSSALAGWVKPGTPICPADVAQKLGLTRGCYVNVKAINRLNLTSGVGPVSGTFDVLVQDHNAVDAPEIVALSGTLDGQMDLSQAVQNVAPIGTVSGTWDARAARGGPMESVGRVRGTFTGVFRLPLIVPSPAGCVTADGDTSTCDQDSLDPVYQGASGGFVKVKATEYALGIPAVKLELTLK